MSEYTREEILKMIEEVGGPENLDLSGKDLSGIDLSKEVITKELKGYRNNNPDKTPLWFSQLTEGINLRSATLKDADLSKARLGEADLSRAHLDGARLLGANLQKAFLDEANLQGASLYRVKLQEARAVRANLQKVRLDKANLREALLIRANLQEARLDEADLQGARLDKANLREASLAGANLQEARLAGSNLHGASLVGADLQEAILLQADLQEVILAEANLQEATLAGANLRNARLVGANLQEARLARANLQEAFLFDANLRGASLAEARLEKVDLSEAASLAGTYFHGAWLDQTRIAKEQLGGRIGEDVDKEYYKAKEAYLLLKNNFNQIGRYDDASWAYVKERHMEKMTYHPKLARTYYAKIDRLAEEASAKSWSWWRFYVKYTLKWAWDWIIEWLCGYGEGPLNVAAVALGVLITFPFLYFLTGLAPTSGQNLLLRDYFLYSIYSFGSMEHPTLQATCWIAQLFTGLESLFGIGLLALLMYTLGRRISRS